jgi:hypothetical protein
MVWVMVRGTPSGLEGGQSRKRLRSDTMETTEAQIIEFGDSARSKLLQTAEREGVDLSTTYLRIAVVPGGCSGLTYDLGWDTTRKYRYPVNRGSHERGHRSKECGLSRRHSIRVLRWIRRKGFSL